MAKNFQFTRFYCLSVLLFSPLSFVGASSLTTPKNGASPSDKSFLLDCKRAAIYAQPIDKNLQTHFQISYFNDLWWSGCLSSPLNSKGEKIPEIDCSDSGSSLSGICLRIATDYAEMRFSDGDAGKIFWLPKKYAFQGRQFRAALHEYAAGAAEIYDLDCQRMSLPSTEPSYVPLRCSRQGIKRWPLKKQPGSGSNLEVSMSPCGEMKGDVDRISFKFSEPVVFDDDMKVFNPFTISCKGTSPPGNGYWKSCWEWVYQFDWELFLLSSWSLDCEFHADIKNASDFLGKKIRINSPFILKTRQEPGVGALRYYAEKIDQERAAPVIVIFLKAGIIPDQQALKDVKLIHKTSGAALPLHFAGSLAHDSVFLKKIIEYEESEVGGIYMNQFAYMAKEAPEILIFDLSQPILVSPGEYFLIWPKGVAAVNGLATSIEQAVNVDSHEYWIKSAAPRR